MALALSNLAGQFVHDTYVGRVGGSGGLGTGGAGEAAATVIGRKFSETPPDPLTLF
jgi:hypothetical protein